MFILGFLKAFGMDAIPLPPVRLEVITVPLIVYVACWYEAYQRGWSCRVEAVGALLLAAGVLARVVGAAL